MCVLWELFVHLPALSRDVILFIVTGKNMAEFLSFVDNSSFSSFTLKKKKNQVFQNLLKISVKTSELPIKVELVSK